LRPRAEIMESLPGEKFMSPQTLETILSRYS